MPYAEYGRVLIRRWWLVPLVVAFAAASAFLSARAQTPTFRSTARLVVSAGRADFGLSQTVKQQIRPLAQRVRTTDIARLVDQEERLDLGPERLLAMSRAEGIVDLDVIQIDVDDTDPARAERIAGAFAQVFAQQHAAADVGKPQAERIIVDVFDRPTTAAQVAPQTRVLVLGAALVGLLAAILLIFALEYFDNTIQTPDDVERILGLSTFAAIPRQRSDDVTTELQPAAAGQRGEQRVN